MDKLDWNDLRYVIAISRSGSAAGAARLLGVSHTTVLRRIQGLEESIGTPLFYRLATGYELTEAGQQLNEVGALVESTMNTTRRVIEGRTAEVAGTIRFTTTDSLACSLMPPILRHFRERYPDVHVDMIVTSARLDLNQREAEVVLRPTGHPPDSWVGKRLTGLGAGLYASSTYLDSRQGQDWRTFDWVVPGGPLSQRPLAQWLNAHIPASRRVMTVDSFVAMRELVLEGVGAAILQLFMGHEKRLRLLETLPHDVAGEIWLLTHVNLRNTRRIKIFMQHIADSVRRMSTASGDSVLLP